MAKGLVERTSEGYNLTKNLNDLRRIKRHFGLTIEEEKLFDNLNEKGIYGLPEKFGKYFCLLSHPNYIYYSFISRK